MNARHDQYKAAGVDPEKAGSLIRGLMASAGKEEGPLPGDFFCQLTPLPPGMADEDVWLALGTDGVGTKLMLGLQTGLLDGIGQDLVGMVYNDLITCGGEPFAFLDYYATGRLDHESYTRVIRSIQAACALCDWPLLGGETAEMPGLYRDNDFDLAGFGVAAVRSSEILSPAHTQPGDMLVGFPSSGFHSNGYSLIRKVVTDQPLDLDAAHCFHDTTRPLKEWLMEPTRLYVDVLRAVRAHDIEAVALAHITGGGWYENLPRALAPSCSAHLDAEVFSAPHAACIHWLAGLAGMDLPATLATFNGGYGLVAICRPGVVTDLLDLFPDARVVGKVVPATGTERVQLAGA